MFRSPGRLLGYLMPIALAALFLPAQASAQKITKTAVYVSPSLSLTSDKASITGCASAQVNLKAAAGSPSGNTTRYRWSTSAGQIVGNGPAVVWDLSGVAPGVYKAFIDIETGGADGECQAFTSTSVIVKPCPPPIQPSCPNVEIVCPTDIVIDQPLTFRSTALGGTAGAIPTYNWTVSAGTIIEGQGTSSIRVDTTGLAGETIKASLSMGGYNLDCSASCAVSIPFPPAKCRKFDEFPDISRNDEKARLDNYGVELQNDPTSTAYVVVYPGRATKSGDVQKHSSRVIDYLVNSRGIDARRIVTLVGGARDELMVDLWICPQGTKPPNP